jgi:exodeoxyribonuclease V beta subunit
VSRGPQNLSAFEVSLAGNTLVEASAGTGKTHTITSLFVRLVLERDLPVREILVVTFTDAATAELRDRIRRRLRVAHDALSGRSTPNDPELGSYARAVAPSEREVYRERAQRALRELDLAAISTIHSFCLRMLQEHAFESGARFGLELMGDTSALVREVADDYWASRIYDLDPSLYTLCDRAFTLEIGRAIIAKLAQRPADLTVLPLAAPPGPLALKPAIDAAFASAQRAWAKHRAAVRALLLASTKTLSQAAGAYTPAAVEADWVALDAYFAQEAPSFAWPAALSKLTHAHLAKRTLRNNPAPDHAFFAHADRLHDLHAQAARGLVAGLRRGAVDYVRAELPRRKQALGVQSFEDLLFSLDAALQGPRGLELRRRIQGRFGAALIDEFQDTDPVQYRIFRSLFDGKEAPLFLVGDPKQSIYAFRGADVFSYAAASEAADAEYTLHENRRSDPSLVKAVNALFARARAPFMLEQIAFHPVVAHEPKDRLALPAGAPRLEILFVPRAADGKPLNKGWLNKELPTMIASSISRFLASGARIGGRPVVPGDIAVLTRKNVQARDTQAALRELQIPTALQSEESVFHSAEAEEVELLLRAMLEPTRSGAVRSALATSVAGLSGNAILAFDTDELLWDQWSETFRGWQAHWTEHGFIHAYRKMLTELGAERRLLALVDGERRMTNLLHLGELLHGAVVRERLGPTALVRWLGLMRADDRPNAELGSEASELRLESDAHAVKLLTIHKSKGLEFPIVYCPFLWDILLPEASHVAIPFHDAADGDRLAIDVVPEEDCASLTAATAECRAENQRLLYVALTRAKHRCSVVWGGINQAESSALAYTLHQPARASAPVDGLREATAARYEGLDDAGLRRDLAKVVAASEGTIGVVDLVAKAGRVHVAKEPSALTLRARPFERAYVDRRFRVGSFTALTADRSSVSQPESQGRDRDEVEERASVAVRGAAPDTPDELLGALRASRFASLAPAPSATPATPALSATPATLAASATPVLLHELPRGTKPGTMLHAILEEHDFTATDGKALAELVAEKLAGAGYSNEQWGDVLVRGVQAMLATPLDDQGLTLASVTRARRADELEFVFPVAKGNTVLTAAKMARAFAAHRGAEVPESYPTRVRELGFELRGFLKGYIDLVFEHEGRFYVVDYKSNHLGPNVDDYRPAKLAAAMSHHDYFLQYHLYTLAVHRWLGRRLRGYDYDAHFGGVLYLFARGMSPDHPPETGIFRDRPSRALVQALSEAANG